jgi:conjugal transfer pilus assembly protein TraV
MFGRRIALLILFIMTAGGLIGCNPYASEFMCPKTENGRCISLSDAYVESLKRPELEEPNKEDATRKKGKNGKSESQPNDITWQREMQAKIESLLKEPTTPIVVPPTVMRILMLPYKGADNELYMLRYVYMFVDDPKWVVGDYLIRDQHRDGVQ